LFRAAHPSWTTMHHFRGEMARILPRAAALAPAGAASCMPGCLPRPRFFRVCWSGAEFGCWMRSSRGIFSAITGAPSSCPPSFCPPLLFLVPLVCRLRPVSQVCHCGRSRQGFLVPRFAIGQNFCKRAAFFTHTRGHFRQRTLYEGASIPLVGAKALALRRPGRFAASAPPAPTEAAARGGFRALLV
jgi:hypothetical protein